MFEKMMAEQVTLTFIPWQLVAVLLIVGLVKVTVRSAVAVVATAIIELLKSKR